MVSNCWRAGERLAFHWLIWIFSHQLSALWTVWTFSRHWMFGAMGSHRKGVEVLVTSGDVCVCECVCVSVCVWVWGGVETMNQSEKKTNSKFLISFVTSPTQPILQNRLLLRPPPSIVSSHPALVVRTPITVSLRHFQNYVISEGSGLKRQRGGGGWDKEIHQRGGGVEILNILPSIHHSPVPSVSSIWLKIFSNCSLHQKACSFKYQKCYTFGLSHYPNSCFYVTTGVFFFSKVST